MVTGNTTTGSLADSLPTIIAKARQIAEQKGPMIKLCDRYPLGKGVGNNWNEVSISKIEAQAIVSESQKIDNPQQFEDSLLTVTPNTVVVHTFVSDKVAARLSKNAFAQLGSIPGNAIARKKDEDGLTTLDGGTSLAGAGVTLHSGYISTAAVRITSNVTEPGSSPLYGVLHGFQFKDLADELKAGIGTYPVPEGMSAATFREGFKGVINGVELYEDGNIQIITGDDAKGGVWAKRGLLHIYAPVLRKETRREPDIGAGGTSMWIRADYAWAERTSGSTSVWLYEIFSDATTPTS